PFLIESIIYSILNIIKFVMMFTLLIIKYTYIIVLQIFNNLIDLIKHKRNSELAYQWLKWTLIISLIITHYYLLKFNISDIIISTYQMVATVLIIPIVLNGLINIDKRFRKKTIDVDNKEKQKETT
ncbi:MAG: hypothetical protein GYA50_02320, partial [Eubacteriaceae bacterium]|nr:hypothetical protein [Eubacteriaceae bacterium]